ncbi:trafficking PGA2-domain-containing protein [Aspergillus caelatus]|uniref:Trafficking PGA2-domain-containing protein n=2 Tax=Aspergillus subgen. Circumdati TaxID=2720871 RepID=A0A5N7AAK1_9EURO|nr:trafficking PGA2-domain-containing protein [Aspergillus caelatus]KAE8365620.1 trafficking PGA2-domain-containing protein [Aspergillus caelatus]KAE8417835.1 trafficking PGA2-domain-containing protein [Aspergillus pseudocaelatus]
MSSPDAAVATEALKDFFGQIYTFFETIIVRFFRNFYNSFATVSVNRWTKVTLSVIGYVIIRPYIELFFKKMSERDRRKMKEKEKAKKEAQEGKKAKVSANTLRGGATGGGKVLGEVENTDDEIEEGEDFATASGVPEWTKNAKKRQKKYMKSLKEAEANANKLSQDQIMELLDWSDSEHEDKKDA